MKQTWIPEWLETVIDEPAVWLVGGAVRDPLLQRATYDYDFIVAGEARALARRVANSLGGDYFDLDAKRDIGRVIIKRQQTYLADFAALQNADILEDLRRRDFTINAIALRLGEYGSPLDPTGGLQDLKDHTLRACSNTAVEQDAIRALRAVRARGTLPATAVMPNTSISGLPRASMIAAASSCPGSVSMMIFISLS